MDPTPPINKVFSPVIQEERQREISLNPQTKAVVFLGKSISAPYGGDNQSHKKYHNPQVSRRERPTFMHHGKLGHMINKLQMLHSSQLSAKTSPI